MDVAYVCEWEKRPKSNHCPSIPLVCAWSCRNLIAFTTDLKNEEDEKGSVNILLMLCVGYGLVYYIVNNTYI